MALVLADCNPLQINEVNEVYNKGQYNDAMNTNASDPPYTITQTHAHNNIHTHSITHTHNNTNTRTQSQTHAHNHTHTQ